MLPWIDSIHQWFNHVVIVLGGQVARDNAAVLIFWPQSVKTFWSIFDFDHKLLKFLIYITSCKLHVVILKKSLCMLVRIIGTRSDTHNRSGLIRQNMLTKLPGCSCTIFPILDREAQWTAFCERSIFLWTFNIWTFTLGWCWTFTLGWCVGGVCLVSGGGGGVRAWHFLTVHPGA